LGNSFFEAEHQSRQIIARYAGQDRELNFVSRVGIVVEEADESLFWLEMISDLELVSQERLKNLLDEAQQLTAIFTAAQSTAKRGQ
jgi:four helix bundle protein